MRELISLADSLSRTIGALILQFSASLMLNGVLIHSTALQPITMISSFGLTRSLHLPDAVGSTPSRRTGAPKTSGYAPQLVSSSILSCSGRGTLIIPEWPSAHFWPFLREGSSRFSSFVAEVFVLPAVGDLLLQGPGQRQSQPSVFPGCLKFRIIL